MAKSELNKSEIRQAQLIKQKNIELQKKNQQLQEILSRLQVAQDSLIESESRFRSVAESANDAIITADQKGIITFWNKRAETLFGYSDKAALGQPLTMLMPERYRKAHLKGLNRFFKTGQVKIMGQIVELEAVDNKGQEFPIELTLANWEAHNGIYVTGIVRDISKRKQEEEVLKSTREQLFQLEKMSTLGRLSAGMAHELNNPVSSAKRSMVHIRKAFSDLQNRYLKMSKLNFNNDQKKSLIDIVQRSKESAVQPKSLDPSTRSIKEQEIENWCENKGIANAWELAPSLVSLDYDLKQIADLVGVFPLPKYKVIFTWQNAIYTIYSLLTEIDLGTDRISEIVEAFKTYTYMDRAPVQNVNIHRDLDNTLIILSSKLNDGINIQKEYAKNLPPIEAYGSELNQVWTNIIDNALDAMAGKGELILRTFKKKAAVVVEIEDSGPGIPAAIQSRIFDPFYTTKAVGEGTGMGLSICHNIVVKKHKGHITLLSKPGKTIITVQLPLKLQKGPGF